MFGRWDDPDNLSRGSHLPYRVLVLLPFRQVLEILPAEVVLGVDRQLVDVTTAHAATHDRQLALGADPPNRLEVAEVDHPFTIDDDSPRWMRESIGWQQSAKAHENGSGQGASRPSEDTAHKGVARGPAGIEKAPRRHEAQPPFKTRPIVRPMNRIK
jgi:hypothetical protein